MNNLSFSSFNSPNLNDHLSLEEQQAILDIQHSILEMVVSNQSEDQILSRLCQMAEQLLPNSVASVMMQQPEGHMDVLCAPTVPPEGQARLNGLVPSETGGSCGNAVYRNEQVFVSDAFNDCRCGDTYEVFKEFGLYACWSTPVRNQRGEAIGSFALSSFEIRSPKDFHKNLLAVGAYIVGIVLQRSQQQQALQKLAFHDSLTDLPNRNFLFNLLEKTLNEAKQQSKPFTLIFIDLDRFKKLNDTLGHIAGDQVLCTLAGRLSECVPDNAHLARVGGDEFVMLVESGDIRETEVISDNLIKQLSLPISIQDKQFEIGCSIGIAQFPQHGETIEHLLKNADTAMYQAKKRGGNQAAIYEQEYSQSTARVFLIEQELRQALSRNEFQLHYQTQIQAAKEQVVGVEALLRWNNGSLGTVSPVEFIPIAEEVGLMREIGLWVVKQALKDYPSIQAGFNLPLNLALNLSATQLESNHIQQIIKLITDSPVSNNHIEIEITETSLISDPSSARNLLEKIREADIHLAIDDFGVGYSSLSYLKKFSVNTLKIDRTLVSDVDKQEDELAIARAIISMAHSLGLEVVAEGVETERQVQLLQSINCDRLQGFYFCKPKAADLLSQH